MDLSVRPIRRLFRAAWLGAWLLICQAASAQFAIDGTLTGSFYNSGQSGHGFFIEVLPDNRAWTAWFVFDDSGQPYWVTGIGQIEGNRIDVDAVLTEGGQFPPAFDAAQVVNSSWGTLTFTFSDCDNATVAWQPAVSGFSAGSLSLTRLTGIDGRDCSAVAAARADLNRALAIVTANHPDPFSQITQAEFLQRTDQLRARLAAIPEDQFPVALAELMTWLGDAHTTPLLTFHYPQRLPVRLRWMQEGLLIAEATAEHETLLGEVITAVNGLSLEQIEARLARVIPHENRYWLQHQLLEHIRIPQVLAFLDITTDTASARLRLTDERGGTREVTVAAIEDDASATWIGLFEDRQIDPPVYLRSADNYWFETIEAGRLTYFAYNRASETPGRPFSQFLTELDAAIAADQPDVVVIDLRANTGGNSGLLAGAISNFGESGNPYNDPGRLFVITGRATFSSGLLNAFDFEQRTQATLVGQPTGGKPNHFGEVNSVALPNSGVFVQYSTRRFELTVDDPQSLQPHVLIEDPTRQQHLLGNDPVLDYVISQLPTQN